MANEREAFRDWHRLFGLLFTEIYTGSPFCGRGSPRIG